MDRCQHCQAQLLDYLYDLLDEPEQLVLESHLADCADCQRALDLARDAGQLLAQAAKRDCSPLRFVAPPAPVLAPLDTPLEQPAVLPLRPRRPARWSVSWVAAAAGLLLMTGLAVYGTHDYQTAHAVVAAHQEQWTDRSTELAAVQLRQEQVKRHEMERLQAIDQRMEREELVVRAIAPQVMSGKTTAPVLVETRNAQLDRVDAQVRVQLQQGTTSIPLEPEPDSDRTVFRLTENDPLAPGEYQLLVHAERPGGASLSLPLAVRVPPAQAVTYLTTDRPCYRAGVDVVHFRSLTLDRQTLRPVQENLSLQYVLQTPDGREQVIAEGADRLRAPGNSQALLPGPDGKPLTGMGAGALALEASLPTGEYTLVARERTERFPEARTRFLVTRSGGPRLAEAPLWSQPVYLPGEAIQAGVRLLDSEGRPLQKQPVVLTLRVDGREEPRGQNLTTDDQGWLQIQARIPPSTRVASLQFALGAGPTQERLLAAIPVHLPGAVVEFHPEGGTLVSGLENRVYFQARDRRGQVVPLRGELLENNRATGVRLETGVLPGLGSFCFTPRVGNRYTVRVDSPVATPPVSLPPVQAEGSLLTVTSSVLEAGEPLVVQVRSTSPRRLRATLTCRDEVLHIDSLADGSGTLTIPTRGVRGVGRVTLVEEVAWLGHDLPATSLATAVVGSLPNPLAEVTLLLAGAQPHLELVPRADRLVYCRPRERLALQVQTDPVSTPQGEKARLNLRVADENRKRVAAVAQVGITRSVPGSDEESLLRRDLPTEAWLASELLQGTDLEQADFLLLPSVPSRTALDLVLGTRKPAFSSPEETPLPGNQLVIAEARQLPDHAELARERRAVRDHTLQQNGRLQEREQEIRVALDSLRDSPRAAAALAQLAWYREQGPRLQRGLVLLFGALCLLGLGLGLVRILHTELVQARKSLLFAGGSAAMLVPVLLLTFPALPSVETAGDSDSTSFAAAPARQADARGDRKVLKSAESTPTWVVEPLPIQGGEGKEFHEKAASAPEAALTRGAGADSAPGAKTGPHSFGGAGLSNQVKRGPPTDKTDLRANTTGLALNSLPREAVKHGRAQPGAAPLMQAHPEWKDKVPDRNSHREVEPQAAAEFRRQLLEELGRQHKELAKSAVPEADKQAGQPLTARRYAFQPGAQALADPAPLAPPLLYWHPVLILPEDGTSVDVFLGPPGTPYRIDVQAHSLDGRLGAYRQLVPGKRPAR